MKFPAWKSMARGALGAMLLPVGFSASGCGEASAADETALARLSERELLGLCDELRDPVTRFRVPQQCSDGWTVRLAAPSNASCWLADRSRCNATAGELRACAAAVLADPCGSAHEAPAVCKRVSDCDGNLVPAAVLDECPAGSVEDGFEGVYAVQAHALSRCPSSGGDSRDSGSLAPLLTSPDFALLPAEGFWAVTSGELGARAVVNIHWCEDPASCRALISGAADPDPSTALTAEPLTLCQFGRGTAYREARSRRSEDPCQLPQNSSIVTENAPGALRLQTITRSEAPPRDDRGCGFVLSEPALYWPPCESLEVYTASVLLEEPLSSP